MKIIDQRKEYEWEAWDGREGTITVSYKEYSMDCTGYTLGDLSEPPKATEAKIHIHGPLEGLTFGALESLVYRILRNNPLIPQSLPLTEISCLHNYMGYDPNVVFFTFAERK